MLKKIIYTRKNLEKKYIKCYFEKKVWLTITISNIRVVILKGELLLFIGKIIIHIVKLVIYYKIAFKNVLELLTFLFWIVKFFI
jgi:hypothetical protein